VDAAGHHPFSPVGEQGAAQGRVSPLSPVEGPLLGGEPPLSISPSLESPGAGRPVLLEIKLAKA